MQLLHLSCLLSNSEKISLATVFCEVICCKYSEANPSILQHAVFIIKYMLDIAIPDVPHRIGIAMRKVCISY